MPPDPAPPTLEQLLGFLESTLETKAFRSKDGTRTRLEFLIDNDALAATGASCYATGTQVLEGLREALARLCYIETTLGDYKDPDRKGTTAADCQAFIANELKNVSPTHDLQSNLQRRMFNATLQKLVELGMWRSAVDAQRFQNQREAERKRREEQRKRDEDILRQQAEARRFQERVKAAEEAIRKQKERMKQEDDEETRWESTAGRGSPFGDEFAKDFWTSFGPGVGTFDPGAFEDVIRKAYGAHWHEQYQQDPFSGLHNRQRQHENQQRQREQGKTKARDKTRGPWYETLGVPANANKATIKSAWRKLSSQLHPDKPENRDDPEKLERLKNINTAKDEGLRGLA